MRALPPVPSDASITMEAEHDQHRRAGMRLCSSLHQPGGCELRVSAMSAALSLSLIVGGLFVVALVWVAVTRRGRMPSVVRSTVVWMRVRAVAKWERGGT